MADSSDVEAALVAAVLAALGSGSNARVFRGMPQPVLLDADLTAGRPNIAVLANGEGRNTTRYLRGSAVKAAVAPSLIVTVIGEQAQFSGVGGAGQVVGVLVGGVGWAYRLNASDTPGSCATALAALVPGAVVNGDVLSVPGLSIARVVADQMVSDEVMRQVRDYQIAFLCSSVTQRDALVTQVDPVLADTAFLVLADGTRARLRAAGERVQDRAENARLWRRDLLYSVEYLTVLQAALPEMLFGTMVAHLNNAVVEQIGDAVMPDMIMIDGSGNVVVVDAAGHVLGE